MITSFPAPDPDNIAGCQLFMFSEAEKVLSMVVAPSRKITSVIELAPQASWLLGYATYRTLSFSEKMQENDAGKYFITEITGFYPRMSPGTLELFNNMRNSSFIIIVKDNNGFSRVAGTPQHPLEFTFDQASGERASDRNGFQFRFRCQSVHESPFYDVS